MTFKEIEKLLISNGWHHHHTNGSHYIYKNDEKSGTVIVPHIKVIYQKELLTVF